MIVMCTDKTGTLTQNRMTIVAVRAAGEAWRVQDGAPAGAAAELVRRAILASARDAFDPMEKAFHALGSDTFAAVEAPRRGLSLEREYGLRPISSR